MILYRIFIENVSRTIKIRYSIKNLKKSKKKKFQTYYKSAAHLDPKL